MPVEKTGDATMITGSAVGGYRALVLKSSMKLYLEHGIRTARNVTPARMRQIATEYTGKPYARSRQGLEMAYADVCAMMEGKNLDEVGEALDK